MSYRGGGYGPPGAGYSSPQRGPQQGSGSIRPGAGIGRPPAPLVAGTSSSAHGYMGQGRPAVYNPSAGQGNATAMPAGADGAGSASPAAPPTPGAFVPFTGALTTVDKAGPEKLPSSPRVVAVQQQGAAILPMQSLHVRCSQCRSTTATTVPDALVFWMLLLRCAYPRR